MTVESYIEAMSKIAGIFCAIHISNNHKLVYPGSLTKDYDVNKHHPTIDEILTNGGFTLKCDTYAPPSEFATLGGEIKAQISPNERNAQAYNSRTKKNCSSIESAIIKYFREINLAYRNTKGEKIGGAIGEFKAMACCSLSFTTPMGYKVEEIMLKNYFVFAEIFNSLCDDYQLQGALMTYKEVQKLTTRATAAVEVADQGVQLPTELDTPLARKIFARAIAAGLIERQERQGDYYKWLDKSIALLAYMLEKIYCIDDVNFPEQALGKLFQVSRLGKARSQLANNKGNRTDPNSAGKPKGYKKIDVLFEEKEA